MNAYVDRAVRRRADFASLQVWAQMALRTMLLSVLLWALLTVALVWYWTSYYGGTNAHLYFGRWFLAWFLTQEIPLTFASLPYNGGRYTITSMYYFLNQKYFLGASFAGWFWHYAPWGAVITALMVGACLLIIFPPRGGDRAEYVRGTGLAVPQLNRGLARGGASAPERLARLHRAPPDGGRRITRQSLDRRRRAARAPPSGRARDAGRART